MENWITIIIGLLVFALLGWLVWEVIQLRRVVPPTQVHIVRKGLATTVYGGPDADSNVYYEFPTWVPFLGVKVVVLPLSVFDINLDDYLCYDKDRLPFSIDVQAFFRIANYKVAATRISSSSELYKQLRGILEDAARNVLSNDELGNIMSACSMYGEKFTEAVQEPLSNWGIVTTKNIALRDVHDVPGEKVIFNIMARKKSEVEKQSRVAIAKNNQEAREAEIQASKEVKLKEQEMAETVGKREAEVKAKVGVEKEKASQQIHDEEKITKEKEIAVVGAEKLGTAEVQKKAVTIEAEGQLQVKKKEAEGIRVKGKAQADAEKEYQLATVTAQVALAKEIGENEEYQEYLIESQKVDAAKAVGMKQAENLSGADIHIVAGAGDVSTGVGKAAGVISPAGGLGMAGLLESLSASPEGKKLLGSVNSFLSKGKKEPTAPADPAPLDSAEQK